MTVRSIVAAVFAFGIFSGLTAGLAETRMMSDPSGAFALAAPAGEAQCCSSGAPSVTDPGSIDGVPSGDQVAMTPGVGAPAPPGSDVTIPLSNSGPPSFVAGLLSRLVELVGAGSR